MPPLLIKDGTHIYRVVLTKDAPQGKAFPVASTAVSNPDLAITGAILLSYTSTAAMEVDFPVGITTVIK